MTRASVLQTKRSTATAAADGPRRYYSVRQAAELLGVSRVTIWRWMQSGRLRAVHLGHRTVRISQEDLEQAQRPLGSPTAGITQTTPHETTVQDATMLHHEGPTPMALPAAPLPDAAQHVVQFYDADASLLDTVSDYIGTGLRQGDAVVVIATAAHHAALAERLQVDGADIATAATAGRYWALDAETTLAQFMVDGTPDRGRFLATIGEMVRRTREDGRRLRAFGEMVALLALDGNLTAAVRLEELWNELQRQVAFTLFCAYPLERLASPQFADALQDVCATHGSVIPTESYTSLLTPDERMRAIILLQEKARRLEREVAEREAAQRALQEESEITETLARIGGMLTATLDVEALVQSVTDAATRVSGAAFGAFFSNVNDSNVNDENTVSDERGETYQLYTLSGAPKEAFAGFPIPRNTDLFGPTFRGEGPIRIGDVTQDGRYGRTPPHQGMPPGHLPVRSYLAVPVRSRAGEVLGGLFFGHPEPDVFSERSERLVTGIAAWASIALDNARLYQDAVAAVHVRDEFLSAVSHDLRTPLTTIHGMTQVSRRRLQRLATEPTGQIADSLAHVEGAVARMAMMIDGLLDLARLESGRPLDLRCQPIDLLALVKQLVGEHQRGAPQHHLRLLSARDDLTGAWDAVRVERVVSNLLSNAIKYSPEGGTVTVEVSQETDESSGSTWARISVQDEGIGIPAAELPTIFERFRRGSNVPRSIPGAGIGLAGAKQIVEQHHGTIAVTSEEGKGSRFTVRLPLRTAGSSEAA